jgi:hypothetical protein
MACPQVAGHSRTARLAACPQITDFPVRNLRPSAQAAGTRAPWTRRARTSGLPSTPATLGSAPTNSGDPHEVCSTGPDRSVGFGNLPRLDDLGQPEYRGRGPCSAGHGRGGGGEFHRHRRDVSHQSGPHRNGGRHREDHRHLAGQARETRRSGDRHQDHRRRQSPYPRRRPYHRRQSAIVLRGLAAPPADRCDRHLSAALAQPRLLPLSQDVGL